jgi:hypothetical protein
MKGSAVSDESLGDTDDAGEGKGGMAKAARTLARALWLADWSVANPDARPDERKAAWKAASEGRVDRVAQARRVLRIMAKRGVTFSVAQDFSEED